MTKRILTIAMILLITVFTITAADYDLVTKGHWLSAVDHTGTVNPAAENSEQLKVSEAQQSVVKVMWDIKPDMDHGGSMWTWGDLRGYLIEEEKPYDCRKVQVELVYSSTTPIYVVLEQKSPKIVDEGSEHALKLPSTKGNYKKVILDLKRFRQPSWTEKTVKLNLKELQALGFQPVVPAGGKSELKIKKCTFVGLSDSKVK